MEGATGPLARLGVEHCVELIERKRRLMRRVAAIATTDYVDLLEQMVGLIFDKIQPPRTGPSIAPGSGERERPECFTPVAHAPARLGSRLALFLRFPVQAV